MNDGVIMVKSHGRASVIVTLENRAPCDAGCATLVFLLAQPRVILLLEMSKGMHEKRQQKPQVEEPA